MTNKEFLNLNNLKKLNKELNDWLEVGDYNNQRNLKIEHNHFNPIHSVGYGLNGDTQMVEFQTQLIEAKAIHISRHFDSTSDYTSVYISSTGDGSRSKRGFFFEYKDSKGKRHTYHDITVDKLQWLFGDATSDAGYSNLVRQAHGLNWESFEQKNFEELFKNKGWELVKTFQYNHCFTFHPKFIKQTSRSIEFGWETNFTYYSHPNTLKITKCKEVKRINLASIGVEKTGYYDHHTNIYIRPEQLKAVKKFNQRFNSISKAVQS